jgi:hypothetical protein
LTPYRAIGSTCKPIIRLSTSPIRVISGGAVRPNEASLVVIGVIALARAAGFPRDVVEAYPRVPWHPNRRNGIDVCLAVDGSEVLTLRQACIFCIFEGQRSGGDCVNSN